jgi:microcystin-dependent protein
MKSTVLLFFFAFMSVTIFAQNGISFQGIARDPQGNAITGQTIQVKFTIGSFVETQDIATDNFGVFSATIGSVNTVGFNNLIFANITPNLKVEVDGTTIYDDKFNTVPYAKAAENGVPAGAIMPFAGSVTSGGALLEPIPGWLVCNGAAIPTDSKYDKLKQVLGTAWGTNLLPDLRGTFLRGVNNGRTDGYKDATDRSVGNFQNDATALPKIAFTTSSSGNHAHPYRDDYFEQNTNTWTGGGAASGAFVGYAQFSNSNTSQAGDHFHTIEGGDSETRPKNAAVVYIIKY